jgi:phosphate:Na+ symporter
MLVGFVESTLMTLSQSIGVILGAKIGTTLTVQLIAFDLSRYALFFVAAGYLMRVLSKGKQLKSSGNIVLGFGLIFFGMGMMGDAMEPLRSVQWFTGLLVSLGVTPVYGVLLAAAFTAVVQSSAATIEPAIALAANGMISLEAALPLAWGSHIGTCATALLASIGTGRRGRQVALAHLIVSVSGVIIAFPFLWLFIDAARWLTNIQGASSAARQLANGHMLFTIVTSFTLLLFVRPVNWLTVKLLPLRKSEQKFAPVYLNSASLEIPEVAVELAAREIMRTWTIVKEMFSLSMDMLVHPRYSSVKVMEEHDDKVDILEKAVRNYLSQLSTDTMTDQISAKEHAYIYIIQDLEAIGDLITKEIAHASKKLDKRDIHFSMEGLDEIKAYHSKVLKKFDTVKECVAKLDLNLARDVIEATEHDRQMERNLRFNHIERLHKGLSASVATSAWHLSVIGNIRTISEKLDDIAMIIIDEI